MCGGGGGGRHWPNTAYNPSPHSSVCMYGKRCSLPGSAGDRVASQERPVPTRRTEAAAPPGEETGTKETEGRAQDGHYRAEERKTEED